jgi:hypothetical protein
MGLEGCAWGGRASNGKTNIVHIEDMITTRYRLDDPDIERIGVERGNTGWRCHRVWLHEDVPKLLGDEIAAILVDANKILAELLQDYEIDGERRAVG